MAATANRQRSRERGAPGRSRVPRREREPEMLRCAQRAFASRGYDAVSMDEIAEAAGVSKPLLYAYFGSKDELYLAAIRHAGDELRSSIRTASAVEESAEARLWRGILALLDAVEAHPEWWLVSRDAVARGGEPAQIVQSVHADMMRLIGGEFAQAASESGAGGTALQAVDMLGESFVGACEATCRWWIAHPEVPKGTVALQLMNMIWRGLGNLLEGDLWVPEEAREPEDEDYE